MGRLKNWSRRTEQTGSFRLIDLRFDQAGEVVRMLAEQVGQLLNGLFIDRGDGSKVAVLGDKDTVSYRPVTVLRDLGSSLELSEGLQQIDDVVLLWGRRVLF